MKHNKKTILLILITITTLILLSTASATQDTNTTTTSSIKEKTTTTEPVVKEKIENTKTKQITTTNKTQKNMKTSTKTVEVNNGNSFLELVNEINTNKESDKYLISLKNNITVNSSKVLNIGNKTGNVKEIEIEGNNYSLNMIHTKATYFYNEVILNNMNLSFNFNYIFSSQSHIIKLNNTNITSTKSLQNAGVLIISNSTIDYQIKTNKDKTTIIEDSCIIGENFDLTGDGTVITNYTKPEIIIGNVNITNEHINNNLTIPLTANYTIINCNITAPITNNANLTIINSNVDIKVYSYSYDGVDYYSIGTLTNNGNINLTNCTLNCLINDESKGDLIIDNCKSTYLTIGCYGNLTIKYSNLSIPGGISATNGRESTINIFNTTLHNCSNSQVINAPTSNVTIENSTFKDNQACVQARKTRINNSTFLNNKYYNCNFGLISGSNFMLNNITSDIIVENSTFKNNSIYNARGLICGLSNDIIIVSNCTFEDNFMESSETWNKYGGVVISIYPTDNSIINIKNNTFKNNHCNATEGQIVGGATYFYDFHTNGYGTDINLDTIQTDGYGNRMINSMTAIITNNQFTNSQTNQKAASILINLEERSYNTTIEITNNNFTNTQSTSETIILNNTGTITMENNTYNNSTIDFNNLVIENPGKLYAGDIVTLKANIELSHPENYDEDLLEQTKYNWYIDGETIATDTPEYTLTVANESMIIYVTPSITNTRSQLLIITPTVLGDKIITPENINQYLFEGQLIKISENTKIIFQGEFANLGEICSNTNNQLFDGSQATFTNTSFIIEANDTTIQNMNINNKDTSNYIITNTGNNNIIRNNKLTTYNTQGLTAAIKDLNSKNTIITQNTITVTGPARDITGSNGARAANTQAILSNNATQSTITYNNITVTNSTDPELAQFSTIEAITAPQGTKNTISYNNIQCTGARFNYGISLLTNIQENTISHNNITVTGYRYCDGIQIGDGAINNTISNNNIQITCLNDTPVDEAAISYGIYLTNQGETPSDNNTIIENNIKINGMVNYGMEIYTATNTLITDNTITLTGAKSMGIGYAHSPNSTITGNTIKTNDDSNIPINSITEELQPLNTGIRIQQESENILIQDNTIQTYDKQGKDTCINIESNNVTVKNNNLTSSTKTGDNTITTTQPDTTTIEDNTAIQQESTTQTTTETLTIGESTTITAQFYDDTYTPTGDGKAIFKVNGKTLRDNQGNVIYADIINGRAELPNINITQEWTKPDTTIQAIYIGDDNNDPITTTPTTVTVTKPEATITLDTPSTATAGTIITLKATVTDGENNITSGRVAFKLNGKTLKNAEGKALYAEVRDGVATIPYTIPEKTKAKEYTLTAVFTDINYDRVEAESKLNVVKA